MIPCAGCARFIQRDARSCPFCETIQRDAPSPVGPAITTVLLGLTLAACGTPSTGDEGASASGTETMQDGTSTMSGTATTMSGTVTTMSETATTMGGTVTTMSETNGEAGVTAYGGPDVDTSVPEEESAGSTAMGSGTSSSSGFGSGSGSGSSSSGQ